MLWLSDVFQAKMVDILREIKWANLPCLFEYVKTMETGGKKYPQNYLAIVKIAAI